MSETITVNRIGKKGYFEYLLSDPITFIVYEEDDTWWCINEDLVIYGSDETREGAIVCAAGDFRFAYRDIALCDDDKLSEQAIKLKQRLLSIVSKIDILQNNQNEEGFVGGYYMDFIKDQDICLE